MGPKMHSTAVISAVTVIWVVVIFSFFSEADLSIIQVLLFSFSSGPSPPREFPPQLVVNQLHFYVYIIAKASKLSTDIFI